MNVNPIELCAWCFIISVTVIVHAGVSTSGINLCHMGSYVWHHCCVDVSPMLCRCFVLHSTAMVTWILLPGLKIHLANCSTFNLSMNSCPCFFKNIVSFLKPCAHDLKSHCQFIGAYQGVQFLLCLGCKNTIIM